MTRKVLVTGSCGFIFSNFIRRAIYEKQPYTFVSIDRVNGNANALYFHKNHTFHLADLRDQHIIDKIFQFERPDIVIHGAAESFVDHSLSDPNAFVTSNVLGTQVVINACLKHNVERMIYVSCYDEKTRACTKNGFKKFDELQVGDLILSINPNSGIVEEKEIEKIIIQDYNGDMYNFNSNRINMMVTPNHRMIYSSGERINWTTAEEFNKINEKKYLPIGKIKKQNIEVINIPELGEVDSNAFFYVCGVFIGNGFTAYQKKLVKNKSLQNRDPITGRLKKIINTVNPIEHSICHSYRIFLDVPEKDKCRKKLEDSLIKLGINFHSEKNKSGEHIYFSSEKWLRFFENFGKYSYNKIIPEWMFNYSYENLYNLWLGIHDSDGHGNNIKGRTISITTVSSKLASQLCYLGEMIGFQTKLDKFKKKNGKNNLPPQINNRLINSNYDVQIVSFSKMRPALIPNPFITKYNGKIWCLKVKDNKNFLTERDGKIAFSGNTDEVYGQLTSESDKAWTEESPLDPRNPYSASKAAGELMVKAAHQSHGLIYNITRSSNNYGPRQTPEKLIPKAIKHILQDKKIPVYGEGLQIRDWTHVFDNCAALMTVLNSGKPNETYNISANQELMNIEVIQKICNAMGSGYNLIDYIPDPRKSHDFRYSVNSSKIRDLGWKPNYKFSQGIIDTVEWYKINQWLLK